MIKLKFIGTEKVEDESGEFIDVILVRITKDDVRINFDDEFTKSVLTVERLEFLIDCIRDAFYRTRPELRKQ
jgi:hypothetical protein